MKPDIIGLAQRDNPHAQPWVDAVMRDVDAGLVPAWIGAVLISVLDDGTARMVLIERRKWIAAKLAQQAGRN